MPVTSRRGLALRQRSYTLGALTIDEGAFELRRGEQEVAVQPLVLETLLFFVKNESRLVTKEQLLEGPWCGACVGDAALYRCVMLVRKLLASAGTRARIVTIRGRGFRFVDRDRRGDARDEE
jgi:two-component system response regulator TrcR